MPFWVYGRDRESGEAGQMLSDAGTEAEARVQAAEQGLEVERVEAAPDPPRPPGADDPPLRLPGSWYVGFGCGMLGAYVWAVIVDSIRKGGDDVGLALALLASLAIPAAFIWYGSRQPSQPPDGGQ